MTVQLARRLFSVDDYYRMAEAGILRKDDRVELIEGQIIEMPPIGSPHQSVVDRLDSLFHRLLPPHQVHVRVQGPVRLSNRSEPVPDIMLLRARDDFYSGGHPGPEDVFLLVEVAHTTLAYDREVKLPLYGREGISEVWIVDLDAEIVELYRQPFAGAYSVREVAHRGRSISPEAFPDIQLAVDAILG